MKERQRYKLGREVAMIPGDHLVCTVDDRAAKETRTFSEPIGRPLVIDTIVTFDADGEFGLSAGIGAVFGKAIS